MKKLLLIFSLLIFIPVLNAEENTYFDLPQISVESLPTASEDTLNTIYIYNNKYYVTILNAGSNRQLQVGDNICNIDINISIPDDYGANITGYNAGSRTYPLVTGSASGDGSNGITIYNPRSTHNFFVYFGSNKTIYSYVNGSKVVNLSSVNLTSSNLTGGCIISSLDNTTRILDYITITASSFYTWEEITEEQVFRVRPEKIYVPSDNLYCYHFISDNILRGYIENPVLNSNINYYDFNLDYHYRQSTGSELISDIPVCLANTTTNYLYRNDIVEILIFTFLVGFIVIFIPFKILMSFFKRRF